MEHMLLQFGRDLCETLIENIQSGTLRNKSDYFDLSRYVITLD